MFGTSIGNMQNVLGQTQSVTTVAPEHISPADLLTRLGAGGVTEWRKMTYLENID